MKIVFFTHPKFMASQSMPRFASMLNEGMAARGHKVSMWTAEKFFLKLPLPDKFQKWLGYLDQYLVFPLQIRSRLGKTPRDTLFVFTDHALGPWVPTVADRPHVIHCHDFLAQRSALGEIPENPTGLTGRIYQAYIRWGYQKGKNFISVSEKTRDDLERFVTSGIVVSEMVYNGMNQGFQPKELSAVRRDLQTRMSPDISGGYLLHVGGNQWYKNRMGVIEIYNAWREKTDSKLPLLMIGPKATPELAALWDASPYKDDIHLLGELDDETVRLAYAGADVYLFPSLAEGFGWPIAEGMASGCPVMTTDEAPMTEVAGDAAFLIPRRPRGADEVKAWASHAADELGKVLALTDDERKAAIARGIANANRFDSAEALDEIEKIYTRLTAGA